MRSKASIKGHPVHAMLVAFPIAFFTGTLLFDVLSLILKVNDLKLTASHLEIAGVISALIAAVPGIIDYLKTVPPNSSAKKRGTKHALLNITHVLIFFIAWMIRSDANTYVVIGMEVCGVAIMTIAGWLGGTLAYRNQIGVDHRYANKGRWKEVYFDASDKNVAVAGLNELETNQMKLVHIGKKRIVIGKTEDGYVAFDDRCTHRGGSLAGGTMICGTVQCPWHGSQFDVNTGIAKAGPATEKIQTYPLTEENGKLWLKL